MVRRPWLILVVVWIALIAGAAGTPPLAQQPCAATAAAPESKAVTNTASPVTVETIPALTVLARPFRGSFDQTARAIMEVMSYAGPKGIIRGAPFGLYYDDPAQVSADSLRWDVCIPVPADAKADAPFEIRQMPELQAAVVTCTGPFEGTAACYGVLSAWVAQNGYMVTVPCQEHWLGDPSTVPPEKLQARIVFPIAKQP
jgi:effector-binding domain-containing protein